MRISAAPNEGLSLRASFVIFVNFVFFVVYVTSEVKRSQRSARPEQD